MKKARQIFYVTLVLIISFAQGVFNNSFGQTNCSQVLVDAQGLFQEGKINEIPDFINSCLASGFTKEEKIEAYKLLSMVYTFLDEDINADQAVLNLLKLDKEYVINPELDPAEFIEVYNTFRTYPIFRVGLKLGTNASLFHIYETNEVSPYANDNAGTYTSVNGFHGGIGFEVPIKEQYEVVPELFYYTRSYNYSNTLTNIAEPVTFTEQQAWLMLPVYFRYKYLKWQVIPYADLGFAFGYLLSAELNNIETRIGGVSTETPPQDFMDSREKFNYFISAGLGAKYKIPMGYVFVEGRYGYQVNRMNFRNVDPTGAENIVHYNNAITENIFSMDFLTIQLGYMFNIYSPKKLEK